MMRPGEDARAREGHEPSEMPRAMPWVVVLVTLSVAVWGAYYFATETGDGGVNHGDRRSAAALNPPTAEPGGPVDGAQVFNARCAACHQATGLGLPGVFPPLANSSWVTGDPRRPLAIVENGLSGPIEVAGMVYSGAMPGFSGQLSDEEILAVVSYVRTSFGNRAEGVGPSDLAAARAAAAGRSGALAGQDELVRLLP